MKNICKSPKEPCFRFRCQNVRIDASIILAIRVCFDARKKKLPLVLIPPSQQAPPPPQSYLPVLFHNSNFLRIR